MLYWSYSPLINLGAPASASVHIRARWSSGITQAWSLLSLVDQQISPSFIPVKAVISSREQLASFSLIIDVGMLAIPF
jgi:hypothetical protein